MKIAIDARELSKNQPGGFRTYISGLLRGLAEVDDSNDYIIYFDRECDDQAYQLPVKSTIEVVSGNRIKADLFDLKGRIKSNRPDIIHFPCNYGINGTGVPTVISLLDCFCLKPTTNTISFKSRLLTKYNAYMTRKSIPKADEVITISGYSRDQIMKFFPRINVNITITHLAAIEHKDHNSDKYSSSIADLLAEPYILLMASVDPRKNSPAVIEAFGRSKAADEGCKLIAVCSHPAVQDMVNIKIQENGIADKAIVLTKVSDAELRELYKSSLAFVFASLEEGFGLPPLEAMSYGCPVISSNSSCMPEVLADAAIYFDPLNVQELAGKIDLLWNEPHQRELLRGSGIERAAAFSWAKTARETLAIYRSMVEKSR